MSLIIEPGVQIEIQCLKCKKGYTLTGNASGLYRWNQREGLVQKIFPYLTADERELLVSQICGPCFVKIFSGGE
ncbi:MAG: hypothetical protein QME44_04515 [Thermodesulfobacteriota bacterium]|nr:hypothetical protein [Thermodesulfobacteriota bacterium]